MSTTYSNYDSNDIEFISQFQAHAVSSTYDNVGDQEYTHGDVHPEIVILAPVVLLGVGALLRHTTRSLPLPHTMQLLILGSVLGFLLRQHYEWTDNAMQKSVMILGNMDPHLMLHVFLPPLIFESAASLEWSLFSKAKWYIFTLAGPGLLLASGITGLFINALFSSPGNIDKFSSGAASFLDGGPLCFQNTWAPQTGLMLGVILSATDPVAVVALLKELGCKASLSTSIEGESLVNDGTALVMFTILVKIVEGDESDTWGDYLWIFLKMSFGGALFGTAFAWIIFKWLGSIFNDAMAEITITVSAAYLCFFIAEYFLHVSGVIAVVCLGLLFSRYGRTSVSPEVAHFLEEFWELLAFFGNTLIFVVAGTVIGYKLPSVSMNEFGNLMLIYLACTLIRCIVIGLVYLIFKLSGVEIEKKDQVVAIWGALRGAVGLSLAMMVFSNEKICNPVRDQVMFHTAGIVVLTICVNSSTMPKLVSFLKLDDVVPSKQIIYDQALKSILRAGEKQESSLRSDHAFDSAVWDEARKYYFRSSHLKSTINKARKSFDDSTLDAKEARRRVLMVSKKSYWRQFQDGVLSNHSVRYLMHQADLALDDNCRLDEWKTVSELVRFNSTIGADAKTMQLKNMTLSERRRHKILQILDSLPAIVLVLVAVIVLCTLSLVFGDNAPISFTITEHIFTLVFLAELLVRIYCLGNVQAYMIDRYIKVDSLVVVLDIIILGADDFLGSISGYTKSIRAVRFVRLFRLLRILRLGNKIRSTRDAVINNEPTSFWSKTESRASRYRRRILFPMMKNGYEIATGFKIAREEVLEAFSVLMPPSDHQYDDIRSGIEQDLKDVKSSLLDMQRLYSEIASSITTSIAARTVLNKQRQITNQLFNEGLLEKNEYNKMLGSIQFSMKQLFNRPPIIAMPKKEDILGQIHWLECVEKEVLKKITDAFDDAVFQRGDVILDQNDTSDDVHVVARGTVVVLVETKSGETVELDELGMGSIFGEIAWALRSKKRGAKIVATSPGLLFKIAGNKLSKIAEENKELYDRLWDTCGKRVSENLLHLYLEHKGVSRNDVRDLVHDMQLFNVDPEKTSICFNTSGNVILLYGTATIISSGSEESEVKSQFVESPALLEPTEIRSFFKVDFSQDSKFMCNPSTISNKFIESRKSATNKQKDQNQNVIHLEYQNPSRKFQSFRNFDLSPLKNDKRKTSISTGEIPEILDFQELSIHQSIETDDDQQRVKLSKQQMKENLKNESYSDHNEIV